MQFFKPLFLSTLLYTYGVSAAALPEPDALAARGAKCHIAGDICVGVALPCCKQLRCDINLGVSILDQISWKRTGSTHRDTQLCVL